MTPELVVSSVHNQDVEIVNNYKYLGTVFDARLKFDADNRESTFYKN